MMGADTRPIFPQVLPSPCTFTWLQSCTNKHSQNSHATGPTRGQCRPLRNYALTENAASQRAALRLHSPLSFFQKQTLCVCQGMNACTCKLVLGTGPPSGPLLTRADTCLCPQGQSTVFFFLFLSFYAFV